MHACEPCSDDRVTGVHTRGHVFDTRKRAGTEKRKLDERERERER